MKKEKTVHSYQRRTKSGKIVTVKQHTAKYDAAEQMMEAAKKKGAGSELADKKKAAEKPGDLGFSAADFKEWYHWDTDEDPKNEAALRVEKALKKSMGAKGYKQFYDSMTDGWSARGHLKAFKSLSEKSSISESTKKAKLTSEKSTTNKISDAKSDSSKVKETSTKGTDGKTTSSKTKKLTAKDYQSMSDDELQKQYDNYRHRTNSSLSRSEQYHKKTIAAEVTRRSEEKQKAEEKSARKAVGGLVSGNTWRYNSSDGSFSTSHSTAWGRPDSSRVEKLIQKAKDAGWKKADHSSSMQPDDKGYRSTERYVSPDGKYELTYHYSAGDFSSNKHHVTISRTKGNG